MFSLSQVQSIFDYGLKGFYQAVDQQRKDAVQNAAKLAAAATTVANKETKMAAKTKQVVLTAGMEATVFNAHLSGQAYRDAFDRQFISSFKTGLEQLFGVENIHVVDQPNEPLSPAASAPPVQELTKIEPPILVLPMNDPIKTILSRRTPGHGSTVVSYLEQNDPKANLFLLTVRDAVIKVVDPARTPENCPRNLPELIKTKSLHATFYVASPIFTLESDYWSFFNAKDGLNQGEFLRDIEEKLIIYLETQEPILVPVGLEFKEEDGTILARYRVKTNDGDERPLLSLKKLLDSERQSRLPVLDPNPLRDTTVAIVLCVAAVRDDSSKTSHIKAVLDAANKDFKALGEQSITNLSIIKSYDKRTLTRGEGKHVNIFAEVCKNKPESNMSHHC